MKEIPLTQGKVAIVDDEDFERLSRYRWHADWSKNTQTWYASRFFRTPDGRKSHIRMHRDIMQPDRGMVVDHRNHDGLDNRRENLRICTQTDNGRNKRRKKPASSRYKGVTFCKYTGRWKAQITVANQNHSLGRYDTEEEAARAYADAAQSEFGEYACFEVAS